MLGPSGRRRYGRCCGGALLADTLELAQRYSIDYILMPPGRPALDTLYMGAEQDARFVFSASIPVPNARPFELYALQP